MLEPQLSIVLAASDAATARFPARRATRLARRIGCVEAGGHGAVGTGRGIERASPLEWIRELLHYLATWRSQDPVERAHSRRAHHDAPACWRWRPVHQTVQGTAGRAACGSAPSGRRTMSSAGAARVLVLRVR